MQPGGGIEATEGAYWDGGTFGTSSVDIHTTVQYHTTVDAPKIDLDQRRVGAKGWPMTREKQAEDPPPADPGAQ